jgi:hypothetical protein
MIDGTVMSKQLKYVGVIKYYTVVCVVYACNWLSTESK